MKVQLKSKLPEVGTTIFTVMTQLAKEHGAINLSQGFPDFNAPQRLLDLVSEYMNRGANQYAPMAGVPELREQIAAKTEGMYGRRVDPDTEVTVTVGATEALFSAIQTVVRPDDEVIMFDPAYDSYAPAVTLAGGKSVHLPLYGTEFSIDWQRLEEATSDKTVLVMLNSPHNPTGAVLSPTDLDRLVEVLRDTRILVLSDEVYEHIIFDGKPHQSVLRHAELAERSFVVSSFGKTYHATGWKVGYCIAPPELTSEFRKVHQFVPFTVVTPMQYAIADYLAEAPEHYLELPDFYQEKRDRFCELIEPGGFRFRPAHGTYFQLLDYGGLSDMPDVDYANWLTREIGVAAIPISVFCEQTSPGRHLRFCFAKDDKTLEQAAERLCEI